MTYSKAGTGSVCVFTEQGKCVAVDLSSDGRGGAARALAITAKEERCTEIDDLILSRYFNMQASYLEGITKRIRVKNLHLPIPLDASERNIAVRLTEVAERRGMTVFFGCEDTAIPSLKILRYDHEAVKTSAVPGVLICAELGGERLTLMNMALMQSPLVSVAENYLHDSTFLIVSDAGLTSDNRLCFPHASDALSTLLLEAERLEELLPPTKHPFRIYSGVEKVRFILKKSSSPGDGDGLFFIRY